MKDDFNKPNYIIVGSSGLVGKELVDKFILENKKFYILERDVDDFFSNLAKHFVSKRTSRDFVIINCAFDSKKMNNNLNLIKEIIDRCSNDNFRIIHWIQVSSISAYQKISDFKYDFFSFIRSHVNYLDGYASIKIKVDRLLYKYFEDKFIDKVTYVIPIVVTGGSWDLVLNNSNMKYIPKFKKKSIISSESLGKILYEISLKNYGKRIKFIIPRHLIGKWNSSRSDLNRYITYNSLLFIYKNYPKIFINNRSIKILCSLLFKITKLHIFFIFKHIHSIEIVSSFDLNDRLFQYD